MQAGESPEPRVHWTIRYFHSGWAFLVPYTLVYFAYAGLKWPVNPGGAGEGVVKGMSESVGASTSLLPAPCSLLHLYWLLHAAHAVLGVYALRSWWRGQRAGARSKEQGARDSANSAIPSFGHSAMRLAPWLGLALLFWIPGVYLEFPADPWQHLARTNEWVWLSQVREHSYWAKSSYFLAYSWVGRIGSPVAELRAFDLYYTACCLLLCWQYYRLARVVGLSERTSLLFVLLNVLTFGNNLFGFYRYYGMSSTVFAQIGAMAMVRMLLEALGSMEQGAGGKEGGLPYSHLSPAQDRDSAAQEPGLRNRKFGRCLRLAVALIGALLVTGGNHKQGLLIAGAGVAAVICWRLVAWRRSMVVWLILAAAVASVAVVRWWPRHPLIDTDIRKGGWMTSWYAFNLFESSSTAFDRAWVMIGAIGGLNLLAAAWLLRRNHVAGWLTLMPLFLLSLPCFALPFANTLAASTDLDGGYVIAFHRILLEMPMGLALVAYGACLSRKAHVEQTVRPGLDGMAAIASSAGGATWTFSALVLSLGLATALPADWPVFNRLLSTLVKPPDDLTMRHVTGSPEAAARRSSVLATSSKAGRAAIAAARAQVVMTPANAYVLTAWGAIDLTFGDKNQASADGLSAVRYVESTRARGRTQPDTFVVSATDALYSGDSQIAALSRHWLVRSVALDHAAQPQLAALPLVPRPPPQLWLQWFSPRDGKQLFAKGAGRDLSTPPLEDRGRLDSGVGNQLVLAGDRVVFQPVLRSYDSSGISIRFTITGPGLAIEQEIGRQKGVAGWSPWLHDDVPVTFRQAGRYEIELSGTSFGSEQLWVVRYHLDVQSGGKAVAQ